MTPAITPNFQNALALRAGFNPMRRPVGGPIMRAPMPPVAGGPGMMPMRPVGGPVGRVPIMPMPPGGGPMMPYRGPTDPIARPMMPPAGPQMSRGVLPQPMNALRGRMMLQ